MGLFKSLSGMVTAELTSADIGGLLSAINTQEIPIFDVHISGDLSAEICIYRRHYRKIQKLAQRKGGGIRILYRRGLYWAVKGLLRRPVLVSGIGILLMLALYLPSRVLFVRVEGNLTIPDNRILSAAMDSGIGFGASRREVRSEKVKNALLSAVPELQWAGVNTYGCVAVISVRERAIPEEAPEETGVASIVADRDGVVLSVTVTNGNGLCAVGQAVQEGDVLISGFTDCGLCITATRAAGEIIAQTHRVLMVKTTTETQIRSREQGQIENYSIILGKKRIDFNKSSGIYGGSCVKMYTEYCLSLPGGFELPVKLVKETVTDYESDPQAVPEDAAEELLTEFSSNYLKQQMIAGRITDRIEPVFDDGGAWCLVGEYACTEMIGRVQTEEIGVIP